MKTFEGEIIKSDYGDCKPVWNWWVKNREMDIDDGEFLQAELEKIGVGKKVRITVEVI